MTRYFFNNETDSIESIDSIRSDYSLFSDEYESFDEYLSACMYYNNGVLTDMTDKLSEVKRELNRKLALAQKYGYDEYADEITDLLEKMDTYSKYVRHN